MTAHGIDLASEAIRDFRAKWKTEELSVFGSILRDDIRPDSDIDFPADYEADAEWDLFDDMHVQDEFAAILGREVDVLDLEGVASSDNRFLKKGILSTAERVYAPR